MHFAPSVEEKSIRQIFRHKVSECDNEGEGNDDEPSLLSGDDGFLSSTSFVRSKELWLFYMRWLFFA